MRAVPGRLAVVVSLTVAAAAGAAPAAATPEGPAWAWPLDGAGPGAVVRRFDPPATPYAAGHRGVDLAGVPGAPVLAAGAGRVTYAGPLAGRGVVVVVHGELRTTYEPVTAAVGVGAQVARGQVLGALSPGHAGCAAAACLHWGLKRGDAYLDPLRLLWGGPVRLLPPGTPAPQGGTGGVDGPPAPEGAAAGTGPRPADDPALRRTSSGGTPSAAAAGAVGAVGVAALVLLGLGLLRGAHGRRPPDPVAAPRRPAA